MNPAAERSLGWNRGEGWAADERVCCGGRSRRTVAGPFRDEDGYH
ncbi:MAG: hypothetical protein WKH64_07160 [Chloroflexia bacterium]